MAERYAAKDVRATFERACEAASSAGLDTAGWVLMEGTASSGVAWRIFRQLPGETGLRDLGFTSGNGFLGMTAKVACETLSHYRAAWWAVADAKRDASE